MKQEKGEYIQEKAVIVQVEHVNLALVSRKNYHVRKKLNAYPRSNV